MKHGSNNSNRRGRSRSSGKRHSPSRSNFESNGPEVKVRGSAQQVLDKYLILARDASSVGDRVLSEGYFQFAEHYYRVLHADDNAPQNGQSRMGRKDGNGAVQKTVAPSPEAESAKADSNPTGEDSKPIGESSKPTGESSKPTGESSKPTGEGSKSEPASA